MTRHPLTSSRQSLKLHTNIKFRRITVFDSLGTSRVITDSLTQPIGPELEFGNFQSEGLMVGKIIYPE